MLNFAVTFAENARMSILRRAIYIPTTVLLPCARAKRETGASPVQTRCCYLLTTVQHYVTAIEAGRR